MKPKKELNVTIIKRCVCPKKDIVGVTYKCEKCGYTNKKTFLNVFEGIEFRFCLKCTNDFYKQNLSKAVPVLDSEK